MRLGGPVFTAVSEDPLAWIKAHKDWGYSAAYCPLKADAAPELIRLYESEAKKSNLIIAEVGAWSNPISPDDRQRKDAFKHCCAQLDLADRIGANCCVNIAGSRNPEQWDGPHEDNLSQDTFDLIVEVTRKIIDTVKPSRTYFTLEPMPWIFPNSVESYVRLLKTIDREKFAVHVDPVNLMNSLNNYYNNSKIIKDTFEKLGPYIKSCHGKDTILESQLTTHINETQPGLGNLDYTVYLKELSKLKDVPLMLEHMKEPEEYKAAIKYLQYVASENDLSFLQI
ncbi:xylose isomerase [bacterium SM23_31]|nr:MAG: xylose isomerase [bacterium SM23_31]